MLRIYAPLGDPPSRCAWVLMDAGASAAGEGPLAQLPRADRVQLIIPAAQVLITRAKVPKSARRAAGPTLAFAVEDASAVDPEVNHVSWLGAVAADADALAVLDKPALERWRRALAAVGLGACEVHAETLLLPRASGAWSLAWDGAEGFVRSGEFQGAATDGGDFASPPLSLRMMLDEAEARSERPELIALYLAAPDAQPDLTAWQQVLGIPLRIEGAWNWRTAPLAAGPGLAQERRRWRMAPAAVAALRPAAWIAGAALAIHAVALSADWIRLGSEQRNLRAQMEARFRSAFPDAVAVTDPAVQMRRQLAAARHRAGLPDAGDFPVMITKVAGGLKELPPGALRGLSYEEGRMTLELAALEGPALRGLAARLTQAGLQVDVSGATRITVRPL